MDTLPPRSDIIIEREFPVPRQVLARAWTTSDKLKQWWGPKGFTVPYCTADPRPGGAFHYCMRSPDGHNLWGKGIYKEIGPDRIVFADFFSDQEGNLVPPARYGMGPDWPSQTIVSVRFAGNGKVTKLRLHQVLPSIPDSDREQCLAGWTESLDKLAAILK